LGVGTAAWTTGAVNAFLVTVIVIGAISAHICVNLFNEYSDFKSGLDSNTIRTPFSGGSGTLPERPEMLDPVLYFALTALGITILIGVFLSLVRGMALLPLGVLGLIVIVSYTPWITRRPALCLMAPGLGFGPLMVMGTNFALTGEYSRTAFAASLVPFFLVNNLLLLNQFPDAEADKRIGRRHLPITIGKRRSSLIYAIFTAFTYLTIMAGIYSKLFPPATLLGMATLFMAVPASIGAYRHAEDVNRLIPYLGLNVVVNIATPVLLAVGFLVG